MGGSLSNVSDLHHLGIFATPRIVHFKHMLVLIKDALDLCGCLVLFAGHRASVTASEGDDFAVAVRITFAYDHGGAHVINPDTAVFLSDVVVTCEADSMKRLAHEFATEFLLNESAL